MKIRRAVIDDAKGVAKVQVDSWKTTYRNIVPDDFLNKMTYESREEKWKEIISYQAVYVAEKDDGEIVGYSNAGKERTGNYPHHKGELYAIYILKDEQRKGLGRRLLKPIINEFVEAGIFSMVVFVLEDNDSRYFYEALGAKIIDSTELEIAGEKFKTLIYGWDDIRDIDLA